MVSRPRIIGIVFIAFVLVIILAMLSFNVFERILCEEPFVFIEGFGCAIVDPFRDNVINGELTGEPEIIQIIECPTGYSEGFDFDVINDIVTRQICVEEQGTRVDDLRVSCPDDPIFFPTITFFLSDPEPVCYERFDGLIRLPVALQCGRNDIGDMLIDVNCFIIVRGT